MMRRWWDDDLSLLASDAPTMERAAAANRIEAHIKGLEAALAPFALAPSAAALTEHMPSNEVLIMATPTGWEFGRVTMGCLRRATKVLRDAL